MMFDLLSALELAISATLVSLALAWSFGETGRERAAIGSGFAAWFVVIVALGATGFLRADGPVGVPGLAVTILVSVGGLLFLALGNHSGRRRLLAAPLPALVAVQAVRLLGVSFVLLHADGRLPAPFAPTAGWGDIAAAALSLPVAWLLARRAARAVPALVAWNVLGTLDLLVAVGLGATSSPGPLRIFLAEPGSAMMTTLPWILIPCFLVPALLSVHIAIFWRLAHERLDRVDRPARAAIDAT